MHVYCYCNLCIITLNSQSCLFLFCIGKYYLVDAGYPNKDGYLASYKGERYHVPDFQRGAPPTTSNRDPDCVPTILDRYKKYVIPLNASDASTSAESTPNMDLFRHELATAIALSW